MARDVELIVYPVKDLARAKELYTTFLGTSPYVDAAYYVGFKLNDHEVGLDPNAHSRGVTGPVSYVNVDDIKGGLQQLLDAGAEELQAITDVGGGLLIAMVKDADGNILGLRQPA